MVSHTSDVIPDTFLVDTDKGLHKEVSSKHLISDHNRPTTVSRSSLSYRLLGSNGYWGVMNVKWKPKVDFATCVFLNSRAHFNVLGNKCLPIIFPNFKQIRPPINVETSLPMEFWIGIALLNNWKRDLSHVCLALA